MKDEFLRYSCQLPLDGFGMAAQKKLKDAKVLVVGVGGLGCPVSAYLTSIGVGTIGLADDDVVSLSNLHRQVLYSDTDVGKQKTRVAKKALTHQNPAVTIICHPRITSDNAADIISSYDIVVDCTDNFDSRYLLNDNSVRLDRPLVYGAIFQYEGQAAVWNVKQADGTRSCNYRDVFPQMDGGYMPNCSDAGVIPTIAGIIGCVQATEVVKLLTGALEPLTNRLFIFDSDQMQSQTIELPARTVGTTSPVDKPEKIRSITHKELAKLLAGGQCQLIDVRSADEHKQSNIGGINIPLDQLIRSNAGVDRNKATVFYCSAGVKSMIAAKHLKRQNPQAEVMSLRGGVSS